jgi:hypothetical protein
MNLLDNLERLAQRFVEGTFFRFFGKKIDTANLAGQLVALAEAEGNSRDDGLLPANYQVKLNPADYQLLVQQNGSKDAVAGLTTHLTTFAEEANYQFDGSLRITLGQNEAVSPGQVIISAMIESPDRGRP